MYLLHDKCPVNTGTALTLTACAGFLYRRDNLEDKTYGTCLTRPSLSLSTGHHLTRVQIPTSLKCNLCKVLTRDRIQQKVIELTSKHKTLIILPRNIV